MDILFPVGRYVGGSLYKLHGKTDNRTGAPKMGRDGKQMMSCSFGVAIRKTGADWKQTPWGQKIVDVARAGFPNGEWQAPAFAWKVTDGDSQVPNKKGNRPCDNEGWAGHWVVWFSGSWLPKLCDRTGSRESVLQYADGAERIKPGHMIEVFGSVVDNKPSESPGVYMNFDTVAHNDDTTPLISLRAETDPSAVGFGGGAPGAAPAVPSARPTPPVPGTAAPAAPSHVMLPKAGATTYEQFTSGGWTGAMLIAEGYMAPPAPAPAPIPVVPNKEFLGTVPAVPAVPLRPAHVMLPKAGATTYEQFTSSGWTDAMLIAEGYMQG